MSSIEPLSLVKSEILDIFMGLEAIEYKQRRKTAANRQLRARRGIELHKEFKTLERDIDDYAD